MSRRDILFGHRPVEDEVLGVETSADRIRRFFSLLPPTQKVAAILMAGGDSQEDVAAVLGISYQAIQSRMKGVKRAAERVWGPGEIVGRDPSRRLDVLERRSD